MVTSTAPWSVSDTPSTSGTVTPAFEREHRHHGLMADRGLGSDRRAGVLDALHADGAPEPVEQVSVALVPVDVLQQELGPVPGPAAEPPSATTVDSVGGEVGQRKAGAMGRLGELLRSGSPGRGAEHDQDQRRGGGSDEHGDQQPDGRLRGRQHAHDDGGTDRHPPGCGATAGSAGGWPQ